MKNRDGEAPQFPDPAHQLRTALVRRIALFIGTAENRATDIPGLTLHRRTVPTAPCSMTYQPGVTVIAHESASQFNRENSRLAGRRAIESTADLIR